MDHIRLGNSGLRASKVCFGTWQAFGWQSSNPQQFGLLIERALELGINFFDCAEQYGKGQAESLLAKVLGERRNQVLIASKFSHLLSHPKRLRKALEGSLKRLERDYIDLYYQHWPAPEHPWKQTLEELLRLKQEGKIRAVGISNWLDEQFAPNESLRCVDVVQLAYNLLWRAPERQALPRCVSSGVTALAYSPLCQGLLSGRFRTLLELPADARSKLLYANQEQFTRVQRLLGYLDAVGAELQCSPAQLSLAWLFANKALSGVVLGCSSEAQLRENLSALEISLPHEVYEQLSLRSQECALEAGLKQSLWGWHSRA